MYPFFLLNFCAFEWYLKHNRETFTFYLFDILIHSFFRTCWTLCLVFWCRTLFLMCMTTWYLMPWWVLSTALSFIDWLIDLIVFYALSAVFQPYNSGSQFKCGIASWISVEHKWLMLTDLFAIFIFIEISLVYSV